MGAIQVVLLFTATAVYLLVRRALRANQRWRGVVAIAAALLVLTLGGGVLPSLKKLVTNRLSLSINL